MELSVAIQAKVEVTPSNWNFGFQPTNKVTVFPVFCFQAEPAAEAGIIFIVKQTKRRIYAESVFQSRAALRF